MLNTTNLSGSPFLNVTIGGLMESVGYLAAQCLMGRKYLGRRNLLCPTLLFGGISLLLALAVPAGIHFISYNHLLSFMLYNWRHTQTCVSFMIPFYLTDKGILVTILAQTGKFLYSAAFAVVYVFTAELFPSTVRNSGLSGCATLGKTATVISPYIVHLVSLHILQIKCPTVKWW